MYCTHKGVEFTLPFKIIKTTQAPLISREIAIKMDLISVAAEVHHVRDIQMSNGEFEDKIKTEYKDLFKGLGCLPRESHVEIDRTLPPIKHQARKIAVAIKQEVKDKLQDLEVDN